MPAEKLSKGGFQKFLSKRQEPQKDVAGPGKNPMEFGGKGEGEGEACPTCGEPLHCPKCMAQDEQNETPADEAKESPSYQRAEKKFGIEKH